MNKLSSIKSDIKSRRVYSVKTVCPAAFIKATPHKAHLRALHAICLQIFRHITQKSLDIRQYACGIFMRSDKKSDYASDAQSLCGIALKNPLISFNPLCYYQNNQAHTHNLFREHLRMPLKACRNQCQVHCLCHKNYPNRHHLPNLQKFQSKPCPLRQ